jgi:hypothetical protein
VIAADVVAKMRTMRRKFIPIKDRAIEIVAGSLIEWKYRGSWVASEPEDAGLGAMGRFMSSERNVNWNMNVRCVAADSMGDECCLAFADSSEFVWLHKGRVFESQLPQQPRAFYVTSLACLDEAVVAVAYNLEEMTSTVFVADVETSKIRWRECGEYFASRPSFPVSADVLRCDGRSVWLVDEVSGEVFLWSKDSLCAVETLRAEDAYGTTSSGDFCFFDSGTGACVVRSASGARRVLDVSALKSRPVGIWGDEHRIWIATESDREGFILGGVYRESGALD